MNNYWVGWWGPSHFSLFLSSYFIAIGRAFCHMRDLLQLQKTSKGTGDLWYLDLLGELFILHSFIRGGNSHNEQTKKKAV